MKKLVLTLTASLACLAAFAQGRVQFTTDSLHLAYYNPDPTLGGALAGQPVWAGTSGPGGMPAGYNLVTDFYIGTSSSSLSLITTTTFSATAPGKFNLFNYSSPTIPGGTSVFIVAQVRDGSAGAVAESTWTGPLSAAQQSQQGFSWYGASSEFSFTLGTSTLQYPAMTATGSLLGGGSSTWAVGGYDMSASLPNNRGAIVVSLVPEPGTFALAGLGAAAMLIFRRRK